MGKKQYRPPRDMEELEDIFYAGDHDKLKRYLDWMDSTILSKQREDILEESVDPSILVSKVKERKGIKTPDRIIEEEKLYVEVTSIKTQPTITERYEPPDFARKINEAIVHAEEKDKLGQEDYDIGCMVFGDLPTILLGKMLKKESITEHVKNSRFLESEVSFLFFRATDAVVQKIKSDMEGRTKELTNTHSLYRPIIFVKNEEMKEKLSRLFTRYPQPEVIVIS